MTTSELLTAGMRVAFSFFALAMLMIFAWGILLSIVDFTRRLLG